MTAARTGPTARIRLRAARASAGGRRDERGSVLVIVALAMTMLLVATALSFDIGREVDTNRAVQAVADAVALDAADFLDGGAAGSPDSSTAVSPSGNTLDRVVQYEASQSALRNGASPAEPADFVTLECRGTSSAPCATAAGGSVTSGTVTVETCPFAESFGGGTCSTPAPGVASDVVNAVRTDVTGLTHFVFAVGGATSERQATAMRAFHAGFAGCAPACSTGASQFTIGSGLLDVNDPLLDSVLSQELGPSTADLAVLTPSGLASAGVTLGQLLAANPSVGSLQNLLDYQGSAANALGWLYNALVAAYGAQSPVVLSTAAAFGLGPSGPSTVTATGTVQLCQLLDVGTTGSDACNSTTPSSLAGASVSALSLIQAIAALADQGHAVDATVSGLGVLTATVTLVSPIALSPLGPADDPCPTGGTLTCPVQARDTQGAVELHVAGISVLGLASVDLSVGVTAGDAEGTLTGLTCGTSPATETATVGGTTDAASLSPSYAVTLAGTTTTLPGAPSVVGGGTFSHTFDGPFGPSAPAPWTSTGTGPSVSLSVPSSTGILGTVLTSLGSTLTTTLDPVLSPLLQALGVDLGYATVADNTVDCTTSVLVG